jgi:hypothetical protein
MPEVIATTLREHAPTPEGRCATVASPLVEAAHVGHRHDWGIARAGRSLARVRWRRGASAARFRAAHAAPHGQPQQPHAQCAEELTCLTGSDTRCRKARPHGFVSADGELHPRSAPGGAGFDVRALTVAAIEVGVAARAERPVSLVPRC